MDGGNWEKRRRTAKMSRGRELSNRGRGKISVHVSLIHTPRPATEKAYTARIFCTNIENKQYLSELSRKGIYLLPKLKSVWEDGCCDFALPRLHQRGEEFVNPVTLLKSDIFIPM